MILCGNSIRGGRNYGDMTSKALRWTFWLYSSLSQNVSIAPWCLAAVLVINSALCVCLNGTGIKLKCFLPSSSSWWFGFKGSLFSQVYFYLLNWWCKIGACHHNSRFSVTAAVMEKLVSFLYIVRNRSIFVHFFTVTGRHLDFKNLDGMRKGGSNCEKPLALQQQVVSQRA